eukprot:TRINITY_DN6383_c0_g1_i2.p2 TRINITY_DN6383_c0_g1~~TRINITY_DN6383_c0_g1_i2.p2  ORF type:complete len:166 (-),score=57.73 TRINITY_DN6383_c0_g1_i2:596-1093(-)
MIISHSHFSFPYYPFQKSNTPTKDSDSMKPKKALSSSSSSSSSTQSKSFEFNVDKRQKLIDFSKNTISYQRYRLLIPSFQPATPSFRDRRKRGDPQTPDPKRNCSKRAFEKNLSQWRRALHTFDDKRTEETKILDTLSDPAGREDEQPVFLFFSTSNTKLSNEQQ